MQDSTQQAGRNISAVAGAGAGGGERETGRDALNIPCGTISAVQCTSVAWLAGGDFMGEPRRGGAGGRESMGGVTRRFAAAFVQPRRELGLRVQASVRGLTSRLSGA